MNFWKVTTGLFWLFYTVFLLSSIPHLAEWFRHLDGAMQDAWMDQVYWALAYGKALAVDGADVLLTLAFLRKMSLPQKSFADHLAIGGILAFIAGFTGFSWYINWQYEVQFVSQEFARAGAQHFLGLPVGQTNPAVGSAFQLFAIVFTFLADSLLKPTKQLSAEELEQQAAEMERKNVALRRLREAQAARDEHAISSLFHRAKIVKEQVQETLLRPASQREKSSESEQPAPASGAGGNTLPAEQKTEVSVESKAEVGVELRRNSAVPQTEQETEVRAELATEPLRIIQSSANGTRNGTLMELGAELWRNPARNSAVPVMELVAELPAELPAEAPEIQQRRKPLTLAEAATVLGCSERHVRTLRAQGKLKAGTDGKILASSVRAYLAKKN